uniref:Uncharacterized protein n=1 Tax=Tanacetum cinerariifolium TaxID=118510 RepID=A0A699XTJ4_TANCI|nr:hypothetical protein [Tanacetum cinerariifolium]
MQPSGQQRAHYRHETALSPIGPAWVGTNRPPWQWVVVIRLITGPGRVRGQGIVDDQKGRAKSKKVLHKI